MPTVPNPRSPSVGEEPLPSARISPQAPSEAFGSGAANRRVDLTAVQDVAYNIYADEKRKADESVITDLGSKLSALETDLKIKTRQRLGQDAFAAPDEVADEWEKATGDIAKSANNDTQRRAFGELKASHYRELNDAVQVHVADQRQKYDAQVTDSYVTNERNAALSSFDNPVRVGLSIANQRSAITDYLNRIYNGKVPAGLVEQRVADATTATHVGVIDRMLAADQDRAAQTYFDDVKDQIKGDDLAKVERALQEGSTRAESQRQSDRILGSTKTEAEAISEVRKIEDAKVRDSTEDRVRREWSIKRDVMRAEREGRMQDATNIVEKTRNFNALPPSMVAAMTVEERKALRSYADELVKGPPVRTDYGTYYMLKSMASGQNTRDGFITLNLLNYRGKLSDSDFKDLADDQAQLRKGDSAKAEQLGQYSTQEQIIKGSLVQAGVINEKTDPDDKRIWEFTREVEIQRKALEENTKKKATTDDLQKIVDRLLIQGVTQKGYLSDDVKRAYQLLPGETLTLRFKDVPQTAAAQIRAQLKSHGLVGTDQEVLDVYRTKLARREPFITP